MAAKRKTQGKTKAKAKPKPKAKLKAKSKTKAKAKSAKKQAGVSDAAVKSKTGKTWAQWFEILDQAGAKEMAHREIARLLNARHSLSGWWSQMVTVAYERARKLRKLHQQADGFSAGVTKTLAAGADAVFAAWDDTRQRANFLKEAVAFSTRNPGKNLRFDWTDGVSRVEVRFAPKGADKTQVSVDHSKLRKATDVKRLKAFWNDALAQMQKAVPGKK